jgi:class 3 adenylate cyclase/tetratricopeptide (TPR) repeat protein
MTSCAGCQHENPPDSRFCNHCGASLELVCSSCETRNPPGARFCNGCGTPLEEPAALAPPRRAPRDYTPRHLADKILTAKSALEGERKQVSVLFADVKGSMVLSEGADPEQWHGILDGFFGVLADGVHRFEGTINQYTGDGIMALFGAPIAHEDHAQRACYAALQLRGELAQYAREVKREHGLGFSVRMGVHSGEVVVGKIGDDLRMDYTAQGHTVGLAARMQELASPDTAYLSGDTARLVSGYFDLDDLGEFPVRNVRDPVRVFELRGIGAVRTRFDASRARGLTRFVGRDDDMTTLDSALAGARDGNGQVVGVVADAGVGKSRLCFEFLERCRAEGLRVFAGGGVAHGKNLPLLPILQVFREYYGITEQDTDQQVREKIAGRMLLFDEEYREVLPILFDFFGAPDPDNPAPRMDPEARQRQLFGVLRRVTQRDVTQGLVVTLIEDLHWIDGASEAWLEEWVDAIGGGTQRLLIVNFRPEYHADWMQKSWYHQLPLLPLGPEAIRELLDDLLGDDPSLDGLAESIHARTAGNPFFTEEVVQSLVESGHLEGTKGCYRLTTPIDRLEVPNRVQPLLASRIDRLPEREKQVLQTASVIGKEFPEQILEVVAELPRGELDEALRALKTAEFIYEQSLYPVAEYAFKHPLTQEVALDSQLRERRRSTHKAVARTIEAVHADKLDEQAALLAHHWDEAGQPIVAASWHRRAAEWAGTNDIAEASRHWHRVRELVQQVPDAAEAAELGAEACRQILAFGFRLGLSPDEEAAVFAEGKRWTEKSRDAKAEGLLETAYTIVRVTSGYVDEACQHGLTGERLLREAGDEELRSLASWTRIYPTVIAGRYSQARELLDRLLEATRGHPEWGFDLWELSAWVWAHYMRGGVELYAGDLTTARSMLERGIELARQHGDPESEGWAQSWLADLGVITGDTELCLAASQRSVEIGENLSSPYSRVFAFLHLGIALTLDARWREATETLEHALDTARERRTCLETEPRQLAWLAEARLGAGDLPRARELAEEAVALGQRIHAPLDAIFAHRALARVLMQQEGSEAGAAIRTALREAERVIEETGARNLRPLILLELAELARLEGDREAQHRDLREAQRLFEEIGAPERAQRAAAELG